MPLIALNRACEESITDYLINTLDPQQVTASYYTGVGNVQDLQAPAVFITSDMGSEVYYNSAVYEITVKVAVKEMAADTDASHLGVLAQGVFNCFYDPDRSTKVSNNTYNFSCYQIQNLDMRAYPHEDALINEITIRVIGCLSGTSN